MVSSDDSDKDDEKADVEEKITTYKITKFGTYIAKFSKRRTLLISGHLALARMVSAYRRKYCIYISNSRYKKLTNLHSWQNEVKRKEGKESSAAHNQKWKLESTCLKKDVPVLIVNKISKSNSKMLFKPACFISIKALYRCSCFKIKFQVITRFLFKSSY